MTVFLFHVDFEFVFKYCEMRVIYYYFDMVYRLAREEKKF